MLVSDRKVVVAYRNSAGRVALARIPTTVAAYPAAKQELPRVLSVPRNTRPGPVAQWHSFVPTPGARDQGGGNKIAFATAVQPASASRLRRAAGRCAHRFPRRASPFPKASPRGSTAYALPRSPRPRSLTRLRIAPKCRDYPGALPELFLSSRRPIPHPALSPPATRDTVGFLSVI